MRTIKYIVVHCTATDPNATVEAIKKHWKEIRGWGNTPGYHYLILRDGELLNLWPDPWITNGAFGHNKECIHVAYIGGIDKEGKPVDNRTPRQKNSMFFQLVKLSEKYPEAKIIGHRDFPGVTKECPCFDVTEWIKTYEPDLSGDREIFSMAA